MGRLGYMGGSGVSKWDMSGKGGSGAWIGYGISGKGMVLVGGV